MKLGQLIEMLEKADPKLVVKNGFGSPHSDRGHYEELAFKPAENVTVESMLLHARSARGKVFTGYKGGDFMMDDCSEVLVGEWGECGEYLSVPQIEAMLTLAEKDAEIKKLRAQLQTRDENRRYSVVVPDAKTGLVVSQVVEELFKATQKNKPFNSLHEGYAVLLEEVDELWDEVKKKPGDRDPLKVTTEAKQVAAMGLRLMLDYMGAAAPSESGCAVGGAR